VVRCLWHPQAFTIGSQLLDRDPSHWWQILATQPHAEGRKQAPITLIKQWKEKGGIREKKQLLSRVLGS